jgi:hypothetical protein
MRLAHTGLVVELEHLKIKTRLTNEKFASEKKRHMWGDALAAFFFVKSHENFSFDDEILFSNVPLNVNKHNVFEKS